MTKRYRQLRAALEEAEQGNERKLRRMVRGWRGVYDYIPLRETQLRALVARGILAPPIKIGPRAIAFFVDDLIEAQQRLEGERRVR